jgi:DNA-binding CsgD family transcriptional regulator
MAPAGFGDELRVAVRSGGACWGVLCLHREDGPAGFTASEARLAGRVARHLGEGLRRALLVGEGGPGGDDAPGVLLVGDDGGLVATTAAAERWLWELPHHGAHTGLPAPVEAVVARLRAIRSGTAALDDLPRVRVRTRTGRWAVLHASDVTGLDGQHVAVVVEAARPAEIAPLILLAHGLTAREGEVAQLALQGRPTKLIARELGISVNTVEHHLKATFAKVGVGSRGELRARVFTEHFAP